MITFDESSREFIARNVADVGKAVPAVGFASYFFEKFPLYLRIGSIIFSLVCLVLGIYIHLMRKGARA